MAFPRHVGRGVRAVAQGHAEDRRPASGGRLPRPGRRHRLRDDGPGPADLLRPGGRHLRRDGLALAARAQQDGLGNVSTQVGDLSTFDLRSSSTDLVVSSYALHHLVDADKRALVTRSAQWLRPGGRLVIADMMFGRGASRRDRDILRQKVLALAAKGPGGWWRIAKNLVRYGLGVGQEHPATPEFWQAALRDAGFTDVTFHPVVAEAGIVSGVRSGGLPVIAARATRPSSLMHASTRPPGKSRSLSRTDHGSCPGDPSSACLPFGLDPRPEHRRHHHRMEPGQDQDPPQPQPTRPPRVTPAVA